MMLDPYMFKSEDLSLTFSEMFPQNLPFPTWEGMKGREGQIQIKFLLSTLTLALLNQGGFE
jgi:hypothetical protein